MLSTCNQGASTGGPDECASYSGCTVFPLHRKFCAGPTSMWCCAMEVEGATISHVEEVGQKQKALAQTNGNMPFVPSAGFDEECKDPYDVENDDADATTAGTGSLSSSGKLGRPSKESAVDFAGSWICARVSGEMEAFLVDMGLSEPLRRAASEARYGIGQQVQNIASDGDDFAIQNILKAPVTMRFRVGGGVQRSLDQEGKPIFIDPSWDGDCLKVTSRRENGDLIAHTRRYLEGDCMVLELTSPQGTSVKRCFDRIRR